MPHEGLLDYPPVRGPASFIFDRIARTLDDDSRHRFYCADCHQRVVLSSERSRRISAWSLVMVLVLLLAGLAAWRLGAFDRLLSGS